MPARREAAGPRLLAASVETAVLGAAAAALVLAGWLLRDATLLTGPPPAPAAGDWTGPAASPHTPAAVSPLPAAVPTRIRIPSLGVNAPLTAVRLDPQGRLQPPPPDRPQVAGWYSGGVTPGARGTAVTVGHVDSRTGPAVFYLLGRIRRGDPILVDRSDGRVAVFTVDAVQTFPKDHFPSGLVYRQTGRPELRTITCGGPFDPRKGYRADVVVFSHLSSVRSAGAGQGRADSSWAASRSRVTSSPSRARKWTPTGRPALFRHGGRTWPGFRSGWRRPPGTDGGAAVAGRPPLQELCQEP